MSMFHRLTPLGLLLAASASLTAQESTGTLLGVVRGEGGKPLAGATIEVSSSVLLQKRVATTDERGNWRLPLMPPGSDYVIVASYKGYLNRKAENVYMPAGQSIRQDFDLKTTKVQEEIVEVVALSGTVDKTETKTATTFTVDTLAALPTGSLNATGALYLAPGVQGGTSYPSVRGGIAGQAQVMVNGISVRDPLVRQTRQFEKVIDDLTQDIQVIQSPMNAKYGFTSSGITNVVTKRGSNDFQGSLRIKLSNPAWNAGTHELMARYADPAFSPSLAPLTAYTNRPEENTSRTYEVTVLGPIWKDHITFAYAGRFTPPSYVTATMTNPYRQSYGTTIPFPVAGTPAYTFGATGGTNPQDVVIGGFRTTQTQQYQLFWQINQNQTLSWNQTVDKLGPPYLDTQMAGYWSIGAWNVDPTVTAQQSSSRGVSGAQYNGIFGNFVVDLRYGRNQSIVQFSQGPGDVINIGLWYPGATSILQPSNTNVFGSSASTNGDPGHLPEKRNSQTIDANVQWVTGNHQIDFGANQLKERTFASGYPGVNDRIYDVPGMLADKTYVVFNPTGLKYFDPNVPLAPTDPTLYSFSAPYGTRNARMVQRSTTGSSQDNLDTTTAIYFNDIYQMNDHWSFMGGLRYEKYNMKDREGTRVDSGSFLPRFMVKYDLNGDNKHLFELSLGQFRGTMGQGSVGSPFSRRPNNQTVTNYWNVGTPGVPYAVDKATLLNVANYKPYGFTNNDLLYVMAAGLKPEVRNSVNFSYKRAYNGGYFRVTGIYDVFKDLLYAKGLYADVLIPDFTGTGLAPAHGFQQILTYDPRAKRDYRSVEIDWQHIVAQGANYQMLWQGNWTVSRTRTTNTWHEGNTGNTAARFDDQMDAAGYPVDMYNPYGEMDNGTAGAHNNVKTWLMLRIGAPKGITNELSLLVQFNTGTPYSLTNAVVAPASLTSMRAAYPSASPAWPNTVTEYFGQQRGQFMSQDGNAQSMDLQWNLTIPITKTVQIFTAATIYNVFNHFSRTGMARQQVTTMPNGSTRAYPDTDPTFRASTTNFYRWTKGWTGARSMNIDLGIRF
jgi:hypothetical protein